MHVLALLRNKCEVMGGDAEPMLHNGEPLVDGLTHIIIVQLQRE
jgi:hypothetical protein